MWLPYTEDPFNQFLRKLSKKGFYEVLDFIEKEGPAYYNEILDHCLSEKILSSRSQVTVIVNSLTEYGLLERTTSRDRPVRVSYNLTDRGHIVLQILNDLDRAMTRDDPD